MKKYITIEEDDYRRLELLARQNEPFTIKIDRRGSFADVYTGSYQGEDIPKALLPLLNSLKQESERLRELGIDAYKKQRERVEQLADAQMSLEQKNIKWRATLSKLGVAFVCGTLFGAVGMLVLRHFSVI